MKRFPLAELLEDRSQLSEFRSSMERGGVAAIPTETFYGLATNPLSEEGVARIFALKRRGTEKALLVLFADREQLAALGVMASASVLDLLFRTWPAPLTVVLSLAHPLACTGGDSSVAVRLPAHERLRRLLAQTGPLTGTSANVSGDPALADPDEVARAFPAGLDFLVDGGRTPGGRPSTLIDARLWPPRLLREGALPWPAPGFCGA